MSDTRISGCPRCISNYRIATYIASFDPQLNTFTSDRLNTAWILSSLASHVTCTSLIGYKAWCARTPDQASSCTPHAIHRVHRRSLMAILSRIAHTLRALHLLSLLVESGAGYSFLWVRHPQAPHYLALIRIPLTKLLHGSSFLLRAISTSSSCL